MDETKPRKGRKVDTSRIDVTKPASIVMNKFGGINQFSKITGIPVGTAHGWTVKGYIPQVRNGAPLFQRILDAAKANKIKLKMADFVDQVAS